MLSHTYTCHNVLLFLCMHHWGLTQRELLGDASILIWSFDLQLPTSKDSVHLWIILLAWVPSIIEVQWSADAHIMSSWTRSYIIMLGIVNDNRTLSDVRVLVYGYKIVSLSRSFASESLKKIGIIHVSVVYQRMHDACLFFRQLFAMYTSGLRMACWHAVATPRRFTDQLGLTLWRQSSMLI